jgi:hypothetical protein
MVIEIIVESVIVIAIVNTKNECLVYLEIVDRGRVSR